MSPRSAQQLARIRAQRKEQIIRAALEVFVQKGYHAANVSDVATRAGVSQGTIYHYFSSKEELFLAAYEFWEIQSLYEALRSSLARSNSPTEQLHFLARLVGERLNQAAALLPANVEFWSHIPRNEAVRKSFHRLFSQMRQALAEVVRQGIVRGEFAGVNPEETAAIMIAIYDGLILQWLANPQSVNWETISSTLTHIVLHGILQAADNQ